MYIVPVAGYAKNKNPLYKCPHCGLGVRKGHIATCEEHPALPQQANEATCTARPQQARSSSADDAVIEDEQQAENLINGKPVMHCTDPICFGMCFTSDRNHRN